VNKVLITKIIWDEWNLIHIKKHAVTVNEVEQSLTDNHAVFISGHTNRVLSLGRSGKRLITTILQQQEIKTHFYVVTARDMAKRERIIYRQEKVKKEGGQNDET
jgi:uncharacterized DUF497 family protein